MLTRLWTSLLNLPLGSRLAIGVWVVLVLGVFGRVLVSGPRSQSVVPIYLTAGERWTASENLYAPAPGLDVYRYPPGVAALFAPLAVLPEQAAGLLWRALGAGVFLFGMARFRRDVVPELTAQQAGLMFALAGVLALSPLNNGQLNLHLAGASLLAVAATARGRWWLAAAWLALAGWLKLYPLAIGLLLVLVVPRLAPRLLALTVLGFLLPFALHDPEYVLAQWQAFVTQLGTDDRMHAELKRVPLDWTVLARTWLGWVPPTGVKLAVSLLAAILAAGVVLIARRGTGRPLVLALVLGSVWMTTFGPATEVNTYSLLSGAAAYLAVTGRWSAQVGYGLLAAAVLRCAFPNDWKFQILGPQAVGTLLLTVAVLSETFGGKGAGGLRQVIGWRPRARTAHR